MRYKLINTSVSITEPVSLAEAKAHLRIDHSDDDAYITALISVARQQAESLCNRVIAEQTFTVTYDQFSNLIRLPVDPVSSVDTFSYIDQNGDTQILVADTDYHFSNLPFEPVLVPPYSSWWPFAGSGYEKVSIAFTAGWADGEVPLSIKQAIMIILGTLYCDRKDVSTAPSGLHAVPFSARALLGPYTKAVQVID